jgi:hypothetical protein
MVSPGRASAKHAEERSLKKIQEDGSFVLYTSFEFETVGTITFSIWDV